MKNKFGFLLVCLLLHSCHDYTMENWQKEILAVESAFCTMAAQEGIPVAFIYFAAENAVILRGEKLISGRAAIAEYYRQRAENFRKVKLTWQPDFINVAAAGDLAYTYGKYVFISADSMENEIKSEGIFHTVWQRQADGSWKYVWD